MSLPVGEAPRRSVVVRRRLIDRLQRRFDVRLTLLTGGAGSGKTTLLSQAMSAEGNHLDVWVPCRTVDHDPARLTARLCRAMGDAVGAEVRETSLDRMVELIVSSSPHQICIVLDDGHLLGPAPLVTQLVQVLPANGHLLLAGRTRPAIDTARLDAAGQLEEIGQDELLMTGEELIDFAKLRGVDVSQLGNAGGWPAFVELASTGTDARSRSYLDEEALRGVDPERRTRLAAFAFVGGGDDEVARAVTGTALAELVSDLPLVRWSGEFAQLHDLWRDLLVPDLSPDERRHAAIAAAAVARRQRDIDRAIDLAASVDDRDDIEASLRRAVIDGIDGGLRSEQLHRWRVHLPTTDESPLATLLDGLLARERDPTSPEAFALLRTAAEQFAEHDEPDLELVALTQLGYLARIVGDAARIASVTQSFERLAERHPPARPFLAIGQAWTALTTGEPERQLAALTAISDDALPAVWQITRRHLIANALFNLGRAAEGLDTVPDDIDSLPVPIPGALVTESQCQWYAGHPEIAAADPPQGSSERHGARDRFIAAGWKALMCTYMGDVETARAATATASTHAGEHPGPMVQAQLTGLEILMLVAAGDDELAADRLRAILDVVPLGAGLAEHLFRHHFCFLYVLVPETREFWDGVVMPGTLAQVRQVIHAFAAARDGDLGPVGTVDWPEPGLIAAHVPVRWAVELALYATRSGRQEGRRLATWLCEHWQRPARAALASWTDHDVVGEAARDVLAHTPTPPTQTVRIRVLGHLDVEIDGHPTEDPNWRRERVQALLSWLVLHPDTSRDRAATALWPDLDAARSAKNLRTTLNYLHGVVEPSRGSGDAPWFVRSAGQRLTLHSSADVDLWRFRSLLDRAERADRDGHPLDALPLLLEAVEDWNGGLAPDLDHEWLELERIHVRSRYVRAACRAAELLVAMGQPDRAIAAARPALDTDPYHERAYRALAEAYRSLDDHTSARAILDRGSEQIGVDLT